MVIDLCQKIKREPTRNVLYSCRDYYNEDYPLYILKLGAKTFYNILLY